MAINKTRISLLVKLTGISAIFILVALVVFSIFSIQSVRTSSRETAVLMGQNKLSSDSIHFEERISGEYGQLSLVNGDLVGENGKSFKYQYELIDKLSSDLNIVATIFIRENNDYRRISTSIVDNTGNRAVDTFLGTGSAAYPSVQSGRAYTGQATILGREYLTEYKPILAPNSSDIIGILFIGIEMTSIDRLISQNTARQMILIVIIAAITVIALIGINILSFTVILLRPIKAVTGMLRELAKGGGDLTSRITVSGRDEIEELARYFNQTLENIKNMVSIIKHKVHALTNTGHELSLNMTKTSMAVDNIAANFEEIKTLETKQHEESLEVNKSLENIKGSIVRQDKLIDEQTDSVNASSSAIEEMTANIHSVSQTLVENSKSVDALTEASEHGRTALQTVA